MNFKQLRILLFVSFGLISLVLLGAGWLVLQDATRESTATTPNEPVAVATTDTEVPSTETTTDPTTAVQPARLPTLPPANVFIPATVTSIPTSTPTSTPLATETPVPTETSLPTNTSVPVIVPNNTPTPVPPTNTPVPSGPQATNANGLIATSFVLEDWRTSLTVNGQIWYEFVIANTAGGGVPYSTLGVMPRRDGQDIVAWYQNNWGGNNDVMPTSGLTWSAWLPLPEAGNYTLRVVVCFDGFQQCRNGNGTFFTLSQEIPVTIR